VRQAIENHANLPLFLQENKDLSDDSSFEELTFNNEV